MGVDWYPFKPNAGTSTESLALLARVQARSFGKWFFDEQTRRESAVENYRRSSRELAEKIDFGMSDEDPQYVDSFRVSVIGETDVLPPQWRFAAYRTILPGDLAAQVKEWERWITAVRQGQHRGYLAELYLHQSSCDLAATVDELQRTNRELQQRKNRWTTRPHFVQVREDVAKLARPMIWGCPLEVPAAGRGDRASSEQERIVAEIERQISVVVDIARRWNRNAKNVVVGYYDLPSLDQFLERANDTWLDEFFAWAWIWQERGYGLYLDY
jgi:hypothetical protein